VWLFLPKLFLKSWAVLEDCNLQTIPLKGTALETEMWQATNVYFICAFAAIGKFPVHLSVLYAEL
jgi:hypothetical protein